MANNQCWGKKKAVHESAKVCNIPVHKRKFLLTEIGQWV